MCYFSQYLNCTISDAATAAYELLATLEKIYQSEDERDPVEAVNVTVGGVLHLISLLDQEAAVLDKKTESAANEEGEATRKPAVLRSSLPGKLEVVEEAPEEDHSMLSMDDEAVSPRYDPTASRVEDVSLVKDQEVQVQVVESGGVHSSAEAELAILREQIRDMEEQRAVAEGIRAKEAAAVERLLDMVATLQKRHEEEVQLETEHEKVNQEQGVKIEELEKLLEEAREALKLQESEILAGVNETITELQEQVSALEMERQASAEMFRGVEEAYEARIAQLLKRIETLENERLKQDHEVAMAMLQSHQKDFVGPSIVSPRDVRDLPAFVPVSTVANHPHDHKPSVASESPMLRSVDSTSPVPTPPNQMLITANEEHESSMHNLLNNQSFISNIAMDEEEGSVLVVDAGDASFDVSRMVNPVAAPAVTAVPSMGQLKAQNVTFLEEIVEYPVPARSPEDPSQRFTPDNHADTTLNQTSLNNTVLFTTCIQDDTPEKVRVSAAHSSSSIFSANSLGEVSSVSLALSVNDTPDNHTANRRCGLDNLSPLGVQHLKRLQSSSDDQDEIPITVVDDSMSDESDDEPYVDRRKLMSSSQLKAAESGFSNHLFDDPNSSRRQIWADHKPATAANQTVEATTSTSENVVPSVASTSSPSVISTGSHAKVTPSADDVAASATVTSGPATNASKEAVAYEAIINDYQSRVEKLLAQLQNTMDGQNLPDPAVTLQQSKQERLNSTSASSVGDGKHDLDRKIDNIRNAQPPPTASKALARTDLDVSMGAEMMAQKMAEIQKYHQELSMDESAHEVGDARFTDREARLNSLLFSPNSFAEEDPSFVEEIVGGGTSSSTAGTSDAKGAGGRQTQQNQQHPWMFQGASQSVNNSFDFPSPNQSNASSSVAASATRTTRDVDESVNIDSDYKNFMDQELRAMGQFLNEGIQDVLQQRPDVTPTNNATAASGPRKWQNMSVDESMMAMFPSPSPDKNHQTIQLDSLVSSYTSSPMKAGAGGGGSVSGSHGEELEEAPASSSVLMNELKLELYFAKDELIKSKMNEKSFHDLNKVSESMLDCVFSY